MTDQPDLSRFDHDPDALAWARAKVQQYIGYLADFERQATDMGDPNAAHAFRVVQAHMARQLTGCEGCTIAAFDERLPEWRARMDQAGEGE